VESIRINYCNNREIRLARLKSFRWLMETFAVGALLVVMSQGEGAESVLRLPFAGFALLCIIADRVAEWYEHRLNH
jgi:hypothetical protein